MMMISAVGTRWFKRHMDDVPFQHCFALGAGPGQLRLDGKRVAPGGSNPGLARILRVPRRKIERAAPRWRKAKTICRGSGSNFVRRNGDSQRQAAIGRQPRPPGPWRLRAGKQNHKNPISDRFCSTGLEPMTGIITAEAGFHRARQGTTSGVDPAGALAGGQLPFSPALFRPRRTAQRLFWRLSWACRKLRWRD